jgi:2',3'-cyclic-nucleotide 2'-phosphodiesterase/3'-nucleotidase/5'-nucleotidase
LVVHSGDIVSASPAVSALLQDEPAIAVMNAIGCDVGVVGNHEFDEGVPELLRLLHGGTHPATERVGGRFPGAAFPCLAANVVWAERGEPLLPPYHVFTVQGVSLGVIGVVTKETPDAVGSGVAGLRFRDEAETVNRYVAELRDLGARAIVVLAHLGGTAPVPSGPLTGAVAELARAIDDDVAVIVGGHTHQGHNTTVAGKLITQAWACGEALAVIDLTIDATTGADRRRGRRRSGGHDHARRTRPASRRSATCSPTPIAPRRAPTSPSLIPVGTGPICRRER